MQIVLDRNWQVIHDIVRSIQQNNDEINFDAFSLGQLQSKVWLIKELEKVEKPLGTVFLLCGWYGILASMMFNSNLVLDKIRSFDIDETCYKIADAINVAYSDGWKFKAITDDIFNINFTFHTWQMWSKSNRRMCHPITDEPSTIINTSCEHLSSDWFKKIPRRKLVVLQTNDYRYANGHNNCVYNIDEFKQQFPLKEILFEGEHQLRKYKRFMLIGMT